MKKTLLFVAAALFSGSMAAQTEQTYEPVTIASGFNQDVIAESGIAEAIVALTSQFDEAELQGIDGGGFVYYSEGVQAQGAMCDNSGDFTTTARGVKYHVNVSLETAVLNALVLKNGKAASGVESGTLVFAQEVSGKSIYVVGTSADGDSPLEVTINYTDGTTVVDNITMGNWDSSSQPSVKTGLGRIASKQCWAGPAGTIQGGYNFMLFESAVNTNPDKKIKSVTIKKLNNTSCCAIFAVSTSNDVVQPTGIDQLGIVAGHAVGYYTIDGRRLSTPQRGLNIVRYADNSARKIVVK